MWLVKLPFFFRLHWPLQSDVDPIIIIVIMIINVAVILSFFHALLGFPTLRD